MVTRSHEIPGSIKTPCIDVLLTRTFVPVVPGTEDAWTHDPFGGDVDDTYVWDMRCACYQGMLMGELEARYLLSQGFSPRRSIYLAFGEDEEVAEVTVLPSLQRSWPREKMRAACHSWTRHHYVFDSALAVRPRLLKHLHRKRVS